MIRQFATSGLALLVLASAAAADPPKTPNAATPSKAPAPVPSVEPQRGENELRQAYAKEYAFLSSEELELKRRLKEVAATRAERAAASARALEGLEARLRELQGELKGRRDALIQIDDELAKREESADTVDGVLSQAEAIRTRYGAPAPTLPDGASPAERIGTALESALVLIDQQSSLRRAPGKWFQLDGSEVEGEILHVGGIAALGKSAQGSGALAPAGDGRLALWNTESAGVAAAAVDGTLPETLPLYLFESRAKPAARQVEKTLADTIHKAGVIGYVIAVLGVVTTIVLLIRTLLLWLAAGSPTRLLAKVEPLLREGHVEQALAASAGRTSAKRVAHGLIPHLRSGTEALESAASEQVLQEGVRLERFETAILVAAAVAPLLGLLGTVTGMIATFDVITIHGTGDPKLLSGGISEALITTQLGLAVAIPAILLGNLLSGWGEGIRAGTEQIALRLALLASGGEAAAPAADDGQTLPPHVASEIVTTNPSDRLVAVVEDEPAADEVNA